MREMNQQGLALRRFAHVRKACAGGLTSAETEPVRGQAFLLRGGSRE